MPLDPRRVKVHIMDGRVIETTEDKLGIGVMWLVFGPHERGDSVNYPWHQVQKVEYPPREKA